MKYFSVFIALIFFMSCNKDTNVKPNDARVENRSQIDCRECQYLDIDVVKRGNDNDCCYYNVYISGVDACDGGARQPIFIDNQFYGYVIGNQVLDIVVCDDPVNVRILGINPATGQWDVVCLDTTLTCDCCKDVRVNVSSCGTLGTHCCVYNYTIDNDSECQISVYDALGNSLCVIPMGQSNTCSYTICPEDGNTTLRVVNKAGVLCSTIDLKATCHATEENCEGMANIQYSIQCADGPDDPDCAYVQITASHDSPCLLHLVDTDGNVYGSTVGNSPITFVTKICWSKQFAFVDCYGNVKSVWFTADNTVLGCR